MTWQQHPTSEIDAFKSQPAVRGLVMKYSNLQTWKTVAALTFDWSVILLFAFACSKYLGEDHALSMKVAVYLAVIGIIATRQHALLVMMHEAAHFRISKNQKFNDFLGKYFASYPTASTLLGYRKHHTQHHRTTNTDQDPDWARKLFLPDWQYPQASSRIARVFSKQFYRGGWDWVLFMTKIGREDRGRMVFWATVFVVAGATGHLLELGMYWVLPLWCVFPAIQRVRSTSEHFGLPNEHEFNGSRNILAGTVETFLFSPHEVNMHLTHHLFPSVPFYHLRGLHDELMQHEVYARLAYSNDSFLFGSRSVLADLKTKGTHRSAADMTTAPRTAA